jgi:hypothetical protein
MCWSLDGKEIYFHSLNLVSLSNKKSKYRFKATLLSATPDDFGIITLGPIKNIIPA